MGKRREKGRWKVGGERRREERGREKRGREGSGRKEMGSEGYPPIEYPGYGPEYTARIHIHFDNTHYISL